MIERAPTMATHCSTGSSFPFFSSRRRHTRYWRDWSSDVCSSDLIADQGAQRIRERPGFEFRDVSVHARTVAHRAVRLGRERRMHDDGNAGEARIGLDAARSEERRVGKECRSRWSPYLYKIQQASY